MSFPFYPDHEYGCPHVRHCPHDGGAAIGHFVQLAGDHQALYQRLYRQIDSERQRNSNLLAENQQLAKKLQQLQLELRLERQNKFATNNQKAELDQAESAQTPARNKGKRCAPQGHAAWYPLNTMSASMFQPRPAAHTAIRTMWQSTIARKRRNIFRKT